MERCMHPPAPPAPPAAAGYSLGVATVMLVVTYAGFGFTVGGPGESGLYILGAADLLGGAAGALLGGVALGEIRRSGWWLPGRGLAVAGLLTSVLVAICGAGLIVLGWFIASLSGITF